MDVWRHHLGAISTPSRPCSLSVTSTAADGGRLVKGWALVNRAVKFNNISALFKTAKRFTCWSNSYRSRALRKDIYTFFHRGFFDCRVSWPGISGKSIISHHCVAHNKSADGVRHTPWPLTFDRRCVYGNSMNSLFYNWPCCWCYDRELRRCMCARSCKPLNRVHCC